MKASVDENLCIGCGLCEAVCPTVFKVNSADISEVISDPVPAEAEADCRSAMDDCPVEAISIRD